MKSIKVFAVAVALATVSFGSIAAQLDTVTATSTTLDGLESTFAAKAAAAGATSYKIIEASGQNHLHGTAILYK
ncbi:YdgH/BhsA/McbA-like domain containing protein [Rahnella aquatilis]|uniref:YdgH/BhsA/McbA-like domain containing protein n=1 Tax=Rahnella aquatilis TaxID=34038 RepID=UPI000646A7E6|nr:YdgH/BhsA/McbA-like domain containing protein [Rahnella aquatilis]